VLESRMAKNGNENDLRQRVLKERDNARGRRFRFSEPLKRDVVQRSQASAGSLEAFCEATALSASTLARWRRESSGSSTSKRSEVTSTPRSKARLKRVTLAEEVPDRSSGFRLVFPSGAELRGVSFEQMRQLLGLLQ
jgi:hypothetical protein